MMRDFLQKRKERFFILLALVFAILYFFNQPLAFRMGDESTLYIRVHEFEDHRIITERFYEFPADSETFAQIVAVLDEYRYFRTPGSIADWWNEFTSRDGVIVTTRQSPASGYALSITFLPPLSLEERLHFESFGMGEVWVNHRRHRMPVENDLSMQAAILAILDEAGS